MLNVLYETPSVKIKWMTNYWKWYQMNDTKLMINENEQNEWMKMNKMNEWKLIHYEWEWRINDQLKNENE